VKEIEWSEESLDDMAELDQGIARRIKTAVERFAETGAGNVKKLQASTRRSSACASATSASDSRVKPILSSSFAFATAKTLTGNPPHLGCQNSRCPTCRTTAASSGVMADCLLLTVFTKLP
jgi:hypothetical protein